MILLKQFDFYGDYSNILIDKRFLKTVKGITEKCFTSVLCIISLSMNVQGMHIISEVEFLEISI